MPSAAASSPEFLALQAAVAGRYSLVREIGRGGMGVVFLARDVALERLVAIKLLPPLLTADAGARERFLREARTAAAISHPHVVPIHLVEVRDALAFFVMGYVDGETLGDRVRRAGALPPDEAMRVVLEVAWALAHAHANGIVHRDVKPDNVLLEAGTGRALVTDFGIARALHASTPSEGTMVGTPQYVSPEVALGGVGDARSDLYSLGLTAWVAATGRLPFAAASVATLLLAQVNEVPPSLAEVAPRLPVRFARAVDRCLRKRPEDRWPDAVRFAAAVEEARLAIPTLAAPVRRFLDEWQSGARETATALTATAVAASEAVAILVLEQGATGLQSFDYSILKWVFAIIAGLTSGLAVGRVGEMLAAARALRRAGFGHAALSAARTLDDADAHGGTVEASDTSARPRGRGLITRLVMGVAGTGVSIALAFSDGSGWFNVLGSAGAVIFPTFTLRAMASLFPRRGRRWWERLLRGRVGRLMVRLAGIGIETPLAEASMGGAEPTVLALGASARAILDALPAPVRLALGAGVPDLIGALERQAMALRTRLDDPAVASRFAASVTALENVRLDLLRLGSNQLPTGGLTEALERVRELASAVDRGLEAREEVERLLAPRTGG